MIQARVCVAARVTRPLPSAVTFAVTSARRCDSSDAVRNGRSSPVLIDEGRYDVLVLKKHGGISCYRRISPTVHNRRQRNVLRPTEAPRCIAT